MRTTRRAASLLAIIALGLTGASKKHQYSPREKAFYADATTVDCVRLGLKIAINSAQLAADGTITVAYTLTDPSGRPLDAVGGSPGSAG